MNKGVRLPKREKKVSWFFYFSLYHYYDRLYGGNSSPIRKNNAYETKFLVELSKVLDLEKHCYWEALLVTLVAIRYYRIDNLQCVVPNCTNRNLVRELLCCYYDKKTGQVTICDSQITRLLRSVRVLCLTELINRILSEL